MPSPEVYDSALQQMFRKNFDLGAGHEIKGFVTEVTRLALLLVAYGIDGFQFGRAGGRVYPEKDADSYRKYNRQQDVE